MQNIWCNKRIWVSVGLIGATFGAAGWILGASTGLAIAGYGTDAVLVFSCAVGVLLSGVIIWSFWLAGRGLNAFVLMEALLGASLASGLLALWIMRVRGVVAFAVDPAGRHPEELAYVAPIALLAIMAILWLAPIRKRLQRVRI